MSVGTPITGLDREIVLAAQRGLPLAPDPYGDIARRLGVTTEVVLERVQRMVDNGVIRRVGVVPNHYKLGFGANGMSVWDIDDGRVSECGRRVGQLDFVSHAYGRPRQLPEWPYNLFAMVHGRSRNEVESRVREIAGVIGDLDRGHEVLYSTRILKKSGLRLRNGD